MSYKDWRVRVDDMLEAIARCRSYTEGMDEGAFAADQRTIDAVARNLEIVGEAAARMPEPIQERHPLVPWRNLAEMRHVLIHEYHSVDPVILWRAVRNDLPPLEVMLRAVLDDRDAPPETWEAPR
ncbi:DUF86 domain-containing protein [Caenispirillum bisanense]|uniref:Uncharacterized conserved protein, contains HEPN domain n=1 Tax=Caenispirillum bisanense TaxID=414052 RepID=A0A286G1P2_9PROT|nr:DUF86 domain-containing protein [Caenispirillum bisanense]SOD89388.1 Uncharacterized conserved protein, contains HEPN domain [Caenispirillum bisanense]